MAKSIAKLGTHKNYFLLALAILAISIAAVLIKGAQNEGATSSSIALLRLGIASVCLALLSFKSIWEDVKHCKNRAILGSALAGIFLALHFLAWIISLEHIPVSTSTFLVTTSPLWVVVISFFVLKETITRRQILGIVIAMSSALFILHHQNGIFITAEENFLKGEILATLGAISIAMYLIIGRTLRSTIDLKTYVFLTYGFATMALVVYHLHRGENLIPDLSSTAWFYISCVALGPQLVGHTILNWGVRRFPAIIVSMTVLSEPILASILAWIILDEMIGLSSLMGFTGILLGIFIVVHKKQARPSLTVN